MSSHPISPARDRRRPRRLPDVPPPAFPAPIRPNEGAPNVLVVMLDDTGFAQLGSFGGAVDTPNIDALAYAGLRYNHFHMTAICAASRASTLSGRNHHAVGIGLLPDAPMAYPGYRGKIPRTAATMPRLLRDAGYSSYAVGKWHLTPRGEMTPAGPFDAWPLGLGFERYYGFLHGNANQWAPNLVVDNHFVDPPRTPEEGYHLTEDMADQAIRLLEDQRNAAPGKPFFLYFAPGAMHSPHHVTPAWADAYRGRFDAGWDALRTEVFQRQLALGVVPEGTRLTERPAWITSWDRLTGDQRRMYARQQEVFAGFLTHTDAQIGRVLGYLGASGQLDNTLVILTSDNGASAEGGVEGSSNEHRLNNRIPDTLEGNLAEYDQWGGPHTYNHYTWAWAWMGNTPFRLWKRFTWLGGTRVPMIVHWPDRIRDHGAVRQTFGHAVDLLPTVLDAAGIEPPVEVDGVIQRPIDGASLLATFTDPAVTSSRDTQYFEMLGSRSIVHGRWKATTDHVPEGVVDEERLIVGSRSFDDDEWSLFDLSTDFSEADDVADRYPEVVEILEDRWFDEAADNDVLPLGDVLRGFASAAIQPTWPAGTDRIYRPGAGPVADETMPTLLFGFAFRVEAVAMGDPAGVLFAQGDWNTGYALFVAGGQLTFTVSRAGELHELVSERPLHDGPVTIVVNYEQRPDGDGTLTMTQDGGVVATTDVAGPLGPLLQHGGGGLRLGHDVGLPVSERYTPPAIWNGGLESVRLMVPTPPTTSPVRSLPASLHAD